eukprot:2396541-Pleurochrysis_carterae.AAC.1
MWPPPPFPTEQLGKKRGRLLKMWRRRCTVHAHALAHTLPAGCVGVGGMGVWVFGCGDVWVRARACVARGCVGAWVRGCVARACMRACVRAWR